LINKRDVLRIRMPFPNISADLALNAHMYICHEVVDYKCCFLKCQTLKPYMLFQDTMQHYWDENPDITRNPFMRPTRIDCDKNFVTEGIKFSDKMKTTVRPDVCIDTMNHAELELAADGYISHTMNDSEVLSLNSFASRYLGM